MVDLHLSKFVSLNIHGTVSYVHSNGHRVEHSFISSVIIIAAFLFPVFNR